MSPAADDQLHPNLDLLRTIAVSCVYIYHLPLTFGTQPVADIGHFGVLLFFVHTSLVLMMSLERLQSRGEPLLRSFYLRRIFRIYPLSIACVCLIVLLHLPRAPWWPYSPLGASGIVANLLLVTNLSLGPTAERALWSLPYEVQMYALLPLFFLAGRRYGLRAVVLLWLLGVGAGAVLAPLSPRVDFFAYVPCFGAGVLAYFLGGRRAALPAWAWPAAMVLAFAVFAAGDAAGLRPQASWAACLLVGIAAPLCRQMPAGGRLCGIVAKYSYGIYLTHLYAMWVAFVVLADAPALAQWSALAALSVALPALVYHAVEAPFIRLGAALAGKLARARPAVTAGA
jgi:peptidoglycan/LPS O-acetylase OafA/YrhL